MTKLRLIADDLTGALDTAAAFLPGSKTIDCVWHGHALADLPANLAFDAGTREVSGAEAAARHRAFAPLLAGAEIAFKKLDSLLRGHPFAEMAALLGAGAWTHLVLAPAFPFQGRITRGGQQYLCDQDGALQAIGPNLVAAMQAVGLPAQRGQPGGALAPGVTVFDAETDDDLREAHRQGRAASGKVLWCGSAGLAQAMAGGQAADAPPLRAPVLGLFGSDQTVTARQLAACDGLSLRLSPSGARHDAAAIADHLNRHRAAMIGFDLPANAGRLFAAGLIHGRLKAILPHLTPPATLIVAGGETLAAICGILGTTSLRVTGAAMPGVPCSVMQGGAWNNVAVISKSGAFGAPNLLRDLLRSADIGLERTVP